jgi:hypothetical protein
MSEMDFEPIVAYDMAVRMSHREIVAVLHGEISGVLKTAEAKIWHAMPVWFIDKNPVVGYKSGPKHVTLLFWNGQAFKEPGLIAAGKFKAAQIHYVTVDEIRVTDLRRWLKKARKDIWDYRGIRAGYKKRLRRVRSV